MTGLSQSKSPNYYTGLSGLREIEVVEAYDLGRYTAQAFAYLVRAPHKGTHVADLNKARWHLQRWQKHGTADVARETALDKWTPEFVAKDFGCSPNVAAAVIGILSAAAFGDDEANIQAAITAIETEIAVMTPAQRVSA